MDKIKKYEITETIFDSDDNEEITFGSLTLREIKRILLKNPARKLIRRLSDPGCYSLSTFNSREILESDYSPMKCFDVNKNDEDFKKESAIFIKEDDNEKKSSDCFIVENETMENIDETEESTSTSTSYDTSSTNLSDFGVLDTKSGHEENVIIIISDDDDDEPDQIKHSYKEEKNIVLLKEEIDKVFNGNTRAEHNFSSADYKSEKNVKMMSDDDLSLSDDTIKNASSSGSSTINSKTDDDDDDDMKDGVIKKKNIAENDSKPK